MRSPADERSRTWPAPLKPFVRNDALHFESNGPHPFAFFSVPFAVVVILLAVAGVATEPGLLTICVGSAAILFGFSLLYSTAFSAWGQMDLQRTGNAWTVVTTLWWSRRSVTFFQDDILSASLYTAPPANMMWPGDAGRQVRIEVRRLSRPIFVGAGMELSPEVLECLQRAFSSGSPS